MFHVKADDIHRSVQRAAHACLAGFKLHRIGRSTACQSLVIWDGSSSSSVPRQASAMQGLAAFVATNEPVSESEEQLGASHNEIYVTYPDSTDRRTQYPGDTRAALTPLLAHRCNPGCLSHLSLLSLIMQSTQRNNLWSLLYPLLLLFKTINYEGEHG